ncbi:MAG TPA: GDSL-type esterase/lipase family protein [Armatimonadota bacterium]
MKALLLGCALLFLAVVAAGVPLLQPNDRLAICGDALVGSGGFSVQIEDYLLMCQPIEGLDIAQFGWGGQTAGDFLARLQTDLFPYKPTVVLTCFGMVDGGGNALEPATAERYRAAQTEMVRALKGQGVRAIVLGSPKCVDSFYYHKDPAQAAVYNKTLGALAAICKEVAAKEGVVYADVFGATLAAMTKAKEKLGEQYLFDGESGNRPSDACKLTMAYAFLKAFGFTEDVGIIIVDYQAGTASGSPGQQIVAVKDGKVTIESTPHPFAYPGYPAGRPQPEPVLTCIPFNDEVNRYVLVVKNLPTAKTKVYWNNEWHNYSAKELSRGVNLSGVMAGPFGGSTEQVNGAVYGQQEQERIAGRLLAQGKPDPEAESKRAAQLLLAKSRVAPLQHTITLQPLAPVAKQPRGPIPVIFDSDMCTDVDDVGALALLNTFMNQGEARLLACGANTYDTDRSSGAVMQAINAYYGHPAIPIGTHHAEGSPMTSVLAPAPPGAYHGQFRPSRSHYTLAVHQRFVPDFPDDDHLPAAVDVYRKALAAAPDGQVVFVSVGVMHNFQDLVQSQPDTISPLSGLALIRKKVRQLVIMDNGQKEDAYFLSRWPTDILWTTWVGSYLSTGKALITTPETNPVRLAYALFGDGKHFALYDGRQSWDLTASWLAVRGPGELWDVAPGYPMQYRPNWAFDPKITQGVVIGQMPYAEVAKLLDAELARAPDASREK